MGILSLPFARLVTFGCTLVFSVIVLGLSADALSITQTYEGSYFIWDALALAVSIITICSIVPMFVIDFLRRGAFTSLVVVEIGWLSVLWILWLATGAYAADINQMVFGTISCSEFNTITSRFCSEWDAVEAFSFLTWIIILAYTVTLAVFVFTGRRAWRGSVRDTPAVAPVQEKSEPVPMTATSGASPTSPSSYPHTTNAAPMSVQRAEV
ncbi:unnamed protein product [Peniophora sp. CBMAI 1063]|nr:unnamed protein product [Peniophora sp. CBMAI 1063]